MNARVIALYLPQFHPTLNNDKWWGKGFTEWTNVGKAKPLFRGHYQPRVPADLGYYDLRIPMVREAQAQLAREAGIDGFCYYHYWFDVNRQELELPFEQVLNSGKPDFPFMLCWANESWHAKFWNNDGMPSKKLLVEQKYGVKEQWTIHFNYLLKAFNDPRYMCYGNKPMFMIYRALDIPNVREMMQHWNFLAQQNGIEGIYFIAQTTTFEKDVQTIMSLGYNAINNLNLYKPLLDRSFFTKIYSRIYRKLFPSPFIYDYAKVYKKFVTESESQSNVYPTLIPNWDHTPRSGNGGYVLTNSTPELFGRHAKQVFEMIKCKPEQDKIVFLKSWNEWGEGNYMEPDLRYGKAYIEMLKKALL